MPAHPLPPETMEEVISLIEQCLREGYRPPHISGGGAVSEAARRAVAIGLVRTHATFETRYHKIKRQYRDADWSLWRAPVYQRPEFSSTPNPYPITPILRPTGKRVNVCVIGDAHDDPRIEDKSRFRWMGKWCAEEAPDYIVQLGDWATFDSMSRHSERGSKEHRMQPSWMQDLESLHLSISAFEAGLKGYKCTKIFTAGNHEDRVARYENANSDIAGALVPQWQSLFKDAGWRIHPYGEYAFIEGVGFIHHPVNGAGRAYGGKTGNQRAGNDSVFSIVHGHDHRLERVSCAKVGPMGSVEMISAGCSLPWGWVEPYAKMNPSGWWWGVLKLTIQDGIITDTKEVSMLSLEAAYGEKPKRKAAA